MAGLITFCFTSCLILRDTQAELTFFPERIDDFNIEKPMVHVWLVMDVSGSSVLPDKGSPVLLVRLSADQQGFTLTVARFVTYSLYVFFPRGEEKERKEKTSRGWP